MSNIRKILRLVLFLAFLHLIGLPLASFEHICKNQSSPLQNKK